MEIRYMIAYEHIDEDGEVHTFEVASPYSCITKSPKKRGLAVTID